MATPSKRKHENSDNEGEDSFKCTKIDTSDSASLKLLKFIKWCEKNNFNISPKVRVGHEGSCAQYGMVAVDDIAEGYCLFQIPRKCLLMPENSNIADLIEEEKQSLAASNQWIPLLVTLLYEKSNPASEWKPYLDLFPTPESIDLPIFWESSDVKSLLKGTGVDAAVERDVKMIQRDFEKLVLPFIRKHSDKFRNYEESFEEFQKIVAFVMAYSFTEPRTRTNSAGEEDSDEESEDEDDRPTLAPPMMVPLADSLNHVTEHNAKLTFGKEALKMVAARPIKKGEEIFNTYGEVSNLHLMHMYGFAEQYPANRHDVVEIPVNRMLEAAQKIYEGNSLINEKCKLLKDQAIISEEDVFVINRDGVVTDEICLQTLKVLTLSKQEFEDYVEREGWSDAESDTSIVDNAELAFSNLPNVPPKWKQILIRMTELHLSQFSTTLEEDERQLAQSSSMTSRQRFSLYTRHGQHKLLQLLIEACQKGK